MAKRIKLVNGRAVLVDDGQSSPTSITENTQPTRSRGLAAALLPAIGGIVGTVGGGALGTLVAPGVGTFGGGVGGSAVGSALGEALAEKLSGEKSDYGRIAKEGLIGGGIQAATGGLGKVVQGARALRAAKVAANLDEVTGAARSFVSATPYAKTAVQAGKEINAAKRVADAAKLATSQETADATYKTLQELVGNYNQAGTAASAAAKKAASAAERVAKANVAYQEAQVAAKAASRGVKTGAVTAKQAERLATRADALKLKLSDAKEVARTTNKEANNLLSTFTKAKSARSSAAVNMSQAPEGLIQTPQGGSVLSRIGRSLEKSSMGIKNQPSPQGFQAGEEAAQVAREVGLTGGPRNMYKQLGDAWTGVQAKIDNVVNNSKASIALQDVQSALGDISIARGDSREVGKSLENILTKLQEVSSGGKISVKELNNYAKKLGGEARGIIARSDKGTTLTVRDEAVLEGYKRLNNIIGSLEPTIQRDSLQLSNLVDLSKGIAADAQKGARTLDITRPATLLDNAAVGSAKNVAGRALQTGGRALEKEIIPGASIGQLGTTALKQTPGRLAAATLSPQPTPQVGSQEAAGAQGNVVALPSGRQFDLDGGFTPSQDGSYYINPDTGDVISPDGQWLFDPDSIDEDGSKGAWVPNPMFQQEEEPAVSGTSGSGTGLTAEQVYQAMTQALQAGDTDSYKQLSDLLSQRLAIDKANSGSTSGTNKPLSATAAQAINNAQSGLQSVEDIERLLQGGVPWQSELGGGILGKIGSLGNTSAQQYNVAASNMADILARLRTGAQINKEEEELYKSYIPTATDTEETRMFKLNKFRDLFQNILNTYQATTTIDLPSLGLQ